MNKMNKKYWDELYIEIQNNAIENGWPPNTKGKDLYDIYKIEVPALIKLPDYPDQLSEISLNHQDIEKQISTYKVINYVPTSTDDAEDFCLSNSKMKHKFVITNQVFLDKLKNGHVPVQTEFVDYCMDENSEYYKEMAEKGEFNQDVKEGLPARLSRMYMAFVREFHGMLFFKSQLPKMNCRYNVNLDMKRKIDLLIICEKLMYGLNLCTDSKKSKEKMEQKNNRHPENINIEKQFIEDKFLILRLKECKNIGKYELYDERYIPELKKLIGYNE